MGPYGIGIALGIAGGLAAKYIYRAVDTHWPESYVYTRSLFERFQRTTFPRYALFRTLPLFAAFLAANVTTANLGASTIASALSGCLSFIVTTDALAAYTALKYRDTRRRILLPVYVLNSLLTIGVALAAYFLHPSLSFLVPPPQEFTTAAWTALLVAVLATAFQKGFATKALSNEQQIALAKKDIGAELWEYARELSQNQNVPPFITHAIMTTEALERPRWVRSGERLFGRIIHPKTPMTFGVTQVPSITPLTDLESIQITVQKLASRSDICSELIEFHQSGVPFFSPFSPDVQEAGPIDVARELIRLHNPHEQYVNTVINFAHFLY